MHPVLLFLFLSISGVGVYISRVEEGSVAERAGLRPGDSILQVNGTPFTAISHDEALKVVQVSYILIFNLKFRKHPVWIHRTMYELVSVCTEDFFRYWNVSKRQKSEFKYVKRNTNVSIAISILLTFYNVSFWCRKKFNTCIKTCRTSFSQARNLVRHF